MTETLWKRRLETIEELVDEETRGLADIGYDHAYLLEALATRPEISVLIGVEIQRAAHRRVQERLPDLLGKLDLRHGDGLMPLTAGEIDTAVIAGVGELKILQMLDKAPILAASLRRLIVCPANFKGVIRTGLNSRGWRCIDEGLARERGHYYPAMVYERGEEQLTEPLDFLGPHLAKHLPVHMRVYLEFLEKRYKAAIRAGVGPSTGSDLRDEGRRAFIHTIEQIGPALDVLRGNPSPSRHRL